jgi:hypothetical protein
MGSPCEATARARRRIGGEPAMKQSSAPGRRDLHNTSTNFAAAIAGQCCFTHMSTGRMCRLPHRHTGACDLRDPAIPARGLCAAPASTGRERATMEDQQAKIRVTEVSTVSGDCRRYSARLVNLGLPRPVQSSVAVDSGAILERGRDRAPLPDVSEMNATKPGTAHKRGRFRAAHLRSGGGRVLGLARSRARRQRDAEAATQRRAGRYTSSGYPFEPRY